MKPNSATVVVASTSAAAGTNSDLTGPVLVSWLRELGFDVPAAVVVPDGEPVGQALRHELAAGTRLIITTGGTGVSPSDQTPEQTAPLITTSLPGIIEAIRQRGQAATPFACLTRGVAGFAGDSLIVNLPGSSGGVRDGIAILTPVLDHVLAQRGGGGAHAPRGVS